ncbi:MAG: sulfite exporter TauE/SafE family protein [Opitutales bacterium]
MTLAELTTEQWVWGILGAIFVGLAKGGLPGMGNLTMGIYAMLFPAKASVGLLLPVLVCADVVAIIVYRREARWNYVFKLLPPMVVGLFIGWYIFGSIDNETVRIVIGGTLLAMTALHFLRKWWVQRRGNEEDTLTQSRAFAGFTGVLGGVATMLANAAGPVAAMYLMAVRLPKIAFVGTSAWLFFMINLIKIPMQANLGTVTVTSIWVSLAFGAFAAASVPVAPLILKRINQQVFGALVWFFVILSALNLLLRDL